MLAEIKYKLMPMLLKAELDRCEKQALIEARDYTIKRLKELETTNDPKNRPYPSTRTR